jgi:hypothetical protein
MNYFDDWPLYTLFFGKFCKYSLSLFNRIQFIFKKTFFSRKLNQIARAVVVVVVVRAGANSFFSSSSLVMHQQLLLPTKFN